MLWYFVSAVSARMILSLVGPVAVVGAIFLGSSRFRLVLVFVSNLQFSLFLLRALSTVQIPPPPASLISRLELFYRILDFF